jgi:pyruvate,water dikinase
MQKYEKNLPAQLARFESVMDESLTMKQQVINLTSLLKFFFLDYGIPMVMGPQMAQRRIKKIFADSLTDGVKAQLMSLGSSLPGNKTAVMGATMMDLAASDTLRSHDSAEAFAAKLEQRSLAPDFLQKWDAFMAEFGSRCPREIDVATPRPYEQPAQFFTQLKQMSLAFEGGENGRYVFESAQAKREEAYRALKALALQKGKRQAKAFDKNYHVLVTLGGQRETGKHYMIKTVNMFRQRALEVGEGFVENGRLDHPAQIFDLTIDDIDHALANPALDLRQLAHERTAPIDKIKKSHLVARIIDSRGKIFYPPRLEAGEGELVGIPISPGVVRGRVKVFHSADEKTLLPGEVLVTRATDPGWTPLFINAGGIILEIGGALQHGAVVAREYGLPCVSGLAGATDILQDGQLVEVDGANGIVRLIENEDNGA